MAGPERRRGQATVEFALLYGTVMVPLLFGIIYVAQILWVWHSIVEFTRDGARYAATHCWQADGNNVIQYMQANVPATIDQAEFQSGGSAAIGVQYSELDPAGSGELIPFACAGSVCEPDAVTVSVSGYQFQHYVLLLKSIAIPPFPTSQAMGGAGYDQTGTCTP
jgi:TadE-like protein